MPQYPRPDRSNFRPQQNAKAHFTPEIDIGRGETTLPDGRPCLIEDWYDTETELDLRTFFYSTVGLTDWDEARHLVFIRETGCLTNFADHFKGAAVVTFRDAAGQEMFGVSVVRNPPPDVEG